MFSVSVCILRTSLIRTSGKRLKKGRIHAQRLTALDPGEPTLACVHVCERVLCKELTHGLRNLGKCPTNERHPPQLQNMHFKTTLK